MINKTISHYKILEKLGEGGMGVVYKAQDTKLDRFVALKFLPPHIGADDEEKKRFIHEAKAASALDHNNICTIYEIDETEPAPGEPGGQMFIAMGFYEGETLKEKIRGVGAKHSIDQGAKKSNNLQKIASPLSLKETIDIAIQTTQGLTKAHEKEIVHRDIKSANIMLTKDGVVKILDFGLAKLSGQTKLTKTSSTLGTVGYMSPEQAQGGEVDHRSDIWSLGVVLYEMISGQLPFKGDYEQAMMYSILNEEPEPLTGLRTGIPLELERIVYKALAKNPDERYQHVDELLVDIKKIKSSLHERVTSKAISKKTSKKSRFIPISAGLLILAIIISIGSYFYFIKEKDGDWKSSIAVLPFEDLSPQKDQEYMCVGMAEAISDRLTKINVLRVVNVQNKDIEKNIQKICKEFGIENFLIGTLQKDSDRIRVIPKLIKVTDGSELWSNNYTMQFESIFVLQDSVSKAIAKALEVQFTKENLENIKVNRPNSVEAYENVMKADNYHSRFYYTGRIEEFEIAENLLKKAIEIDPNYVDAIIRLADLYNTYYDLHAKNEKEKSKYLGLQEEYIQRASELNPNRADVNAVAGYFYDAQGNLEEAYRYYIKAFEIDANNRGPNYGLAYLFMETGLYELSIEHFAKCIDFSPFDIVIYFHRASIFYNYGKFDDAIKDLKKIYEIDSNFMDAFLLLVETYILQRNYDEVNKLLPLLEAKNPEGFSRLKALTFASKGEKEKALMTYTRPNINLYLLLGMNDKALELMNENYKSDLELNNSRYLQLKNFPAFGNLRDDIRFQELLAKYKKMYDENLKKYGNI